MIDVSLKCIIFFRTRKKEWKQAVSVIVCPDQHSSDFGEDHPMTVCIIVHRA